MKRHNTAIQSSQKPATQDPAKDAGARGGLRVYGRGGVLEAITRREYKVGYRKLQTGSFASSQEQKEWEDFRDSLSPKSLAMVLDDSWE